MPRAADRWELGSQPHWLRFERRADAEPRPWDSGGELFASGRDALRAVIHARGWRRVWAPTYLCQEVVAALDETGAEVALYPDNPTLPAPRLDDVPDRAEEAVLLVNYFGLRSRDEQPRLRRAALIEDHTHAPCSPWARSSLADFCVASLRKLLPLPDGGAAWSRRHATPGPAPGAEPRTLAGSDRLAGYLLKDLYLQGHDVDKATYRELLARGEDRMTGGPPAPISVLARELLRVFPLTAWAEHQRRLFEHGLRHLPSVRVLRPRDPAATPFGFAVVFADARQRDRVRERLTEERVYCSALWPLDEPRHPGVPEGDRDLARRLVVLPCDARYDAADVERAARKLEQAVRSA